MNRQIRKYNDEYITDISGKAKDGVIYIGDWYVFENDAKTVLRAKLLATVFSLLSAVLFVAAGFLDAEASYTAYVFMPYIITFLPIVFSVADGFKLLSFGERLTHKQYDNTVVNLRHTSLATAILSGLSLIGNAVMYISGLGFDKILFRHLTQDIIFTICILAILILNILVYFVQKKLACKTVKNEK